MVERNGQAFNSLAKVNISSIHTLQNKWNNMNDKNVEGKDIKKAKKMLKNSSGMGTKLNLMDPEVFMEFTEAHPAILSSDLKLEMESESKRQEDKKPNKNFMNGEFPSRKRNSMTEFEARVLSLLANETDTVASKHKPLQQSIAILNTMNLQDDQLFKAIDMLHENENAIKFLLIPE